MAEHTCMHMHTEKTHLKLSQVKAPDLLRSGCFDSVILFDIGIFLTCPLSFSCFKLAVPHKFSKTLRD